MLPEKEKVQGKQNSALIQDVDNPSVRGKQPLLLGYFSTFKQQILNVLGMYNFLLQKEARSNHILVSAAHASREKNM